MKLSLLRKLVDSDCIYSSGNFEDPTRLSIELPTTGVAYAAPQ